MEPPLTGREAIVLAARFNISGSFLCETFALASPEIPQIGREAGPELYTHVGSTASRPRRPVLVTAMISTAFVESDIDKSSTPAWLSIEQ